MVAGNRFVAEPFGQCMRDTLGEASVVHEDERGAVPADQLAQPGVEIAPLFGRHHGLEVRRWHLDGEIDVALVPEIDDLARHRLTVAVCAGQEARDRLHRLHRRRQPDARWPPAAVRLHQLVQPREAEGEVRATTVARQGVNLVHDHRAHAPQPLAPPLCGEQ